MSNHHPTTTDEISRATLEVMAGVGFTPIETHEIDFGREMMARLMQHEVASRETVLGARALQPTSSLVFREDGVIVGALGVLFLTAEAFEQMKQGEFDALNLDLSGLSPPDEPPAAGYMWGIAVTAKTAIAAANEAGAALRIGGWRRIPFITKAVTAVGRHVGITRGGYAPLRHANDDLLIRMPMLEAAE